MTASGFSGNESPRWGCHRPCSDCEGTCASTCWKEYAARLRTVHANWLSPLNSLPRIGRREELGGIRIYWAKNTLVSPEVLSVALAKAQYRAFGSVGSMDTSNGKSLHVFPVGAVMQRFGRERST